MASVTVPSIDQNVASGWTEQDINLYQKLPYFFAETQIARRKTWTCWNKYMGTRKWTPNMGDTLRVVRTEPSPHLRQFATPNTYSTMPVKDIVDIRETFVEAGVYRHRFESLDLSFVPDFRDFLTHVNDHAQDVMQKMERFEDVYLRSQVFYRSAFVWVANRTDDSLIAAPTGLGNAANDAANSKNADWVQAMIAQLGNPGNLTLLGINHLLNVMETDLRVPFHMGGDGKPGDNSPMQGMYVLQCSAEAYNQFTFDEWLLANKNCSLDVVQEQFRGNLFGRITCRLEDLPLRMTADGTFPEPEVRESTASAYNFGETVPNPEYTGAPYEIAFLIGAKGYEALNIGPPPAAFSGNGMPKGFGKMFWNGEVQITKNILQTVLDGTGAEVLTTNMYGEILRVIAQGVFGVVPVQRRNIIPIIFKRKRQTAN